jgi:hypothetical protein
VELLKKLPGHPARRQWTMEVVRDQILFLWAKAMEPVNINRYFVAMYGADVISVQQVLN